MKTPRRVHRPGNLKGILASSAVALLLVAGSFLASVVLAPLDAPMHVLQAPSAIASQALSSKGVNGTLASFTALYPEMVPALLPPTLYLPSLMR